MKFPGRCRSILYRELAEDPYLIKRIPTNSIGCFLDVGAAYGITAIQAKLNHTSMKVVAIEPDYRTFEDLKSNVDNMYIYTHNLALGDGADFYLAKERKTPLCNRFVPKTETSEAIFSKSFTLKQIVDIAKVDVDSLWIKVDTEGAERYLFDIQSLEILKKAKVIVMEAHGNNDVGPIEDFLKLLDDSHLEDTHFISKKKTAPTLMNIKIVRKDFLNFLQARGIKIDEI